MGRLSEFSVSAELKVPHPREAAALTHAAVEESLLQEWDAHVPEVISEYLEFECPATVKRYVVPLKPA
jgi:hypothetical protein